MITRQFITELATKLQTTEENIAREYCQHLFLSYFYKKKGAEKIIFKGGTALRLIFKSPRFSEDLDFSASNDETVTISEINRLVDNTLNDIKNEGIECEKEVKPNTQGETSGGYFAIIKLRMIEFDSEIRIQISFRSPDKVVSNTILIQNGFIAPYVVVFLIEFLLVSEKIAALLERKKPRDFFDLYFILRNSQLVNSVSKKEGLKNNLLQVLTEISNLEKELKVFLPISYHVLLKDFKERLQKEIEEHIS